MADIDAGFPVSPEPAKPAPRARPHHPAKSPTAAPEVELPPPLLLPLPPRAVVLVKFEFERERRHPVATEATHQAPGGQTGACATLPHSQTLPYPVQDVSSDDPDQEPETPSLIDPRTQRLNVFEPFFV